MRVFIPAFFFYVEIIIMNKQIVIMYHAISSDSQKNVLGSFPISMQRFQYQILSAIKKGYKIGRLANLQQDKLDNQNNYLYITGDDGTVDWTRNILPWCEQQGFYTHTALISGIWYQPPIYPLTHLILVLLILRDPKKLKALTAELKQNYLTQQQLKYIQTIYHYETEEYRQIIKGAFNLILEQKLAYQLLGQFSQQEKQALEQRFENSAYYKQFQYADIGVHTVSHWALDKDTSAYINQEIIQCEQDLQQQGLTISPYYTSPMKPKQGASLEDLIKPLKQRGYAGILASYAGTWNKQDFIIPRIDAKDVETVLDITVYQA